MRAGVTDSEVAILFEIVSVDVRVELCCRGPRAAVLEYKRTRSAGAR